MTESKITSIPKIRKVYYDTYANLPTTGVATSDLGFATDRQILYRWSGSAWQPISAGLVQASAGDILETSADTENIENGAAYTKTKEIQIGRTGEYRIKFALFADTADGFARIYKNGVAVGTEQAMPYSYETRSEDIASWLGGDLCQLYAYRSGGAGNAKVKEFRLYTTTPIINTILIN